jgi:PBSX family phage terminase large subunit
LKAYTAAHRNLFAGFGKFSDRVLYGCFGCGKTYSTMQAFGLYLLTLNQYTDKRFNFALVGRTQAAVKRNMCNVLSVLFGSDFRYDSSRKSGKTHDAVLFGHSLFIIGLNDSGSEARIRGLTDIMGMIHDEVSLCFEEQFDLIQGRLRGAKLPPEVPPVFRTGWYLGTTNPDVPTHWILQKAEQGVFDLVKWSMDDAIWDGAEEYYEKLIRTYKSSEALYKRFVLGEWTGNDLQVYPQFNPKLHIVKASEVDIDYKQMRRTFLSVDYGSNHPTAILLISRTYDGEYIVSREIKLTTTAPSDIVAKVSLIYQEFAGKGITLSPMYVDPSAAALKDELRKVGIDYVNAFNSHKDGIATVRSYLADSKLLVFDTCDNLIKEFYSYQFKNENSDDVVKLNDDFVDALRYGVHTDSTLAG